MKRIKVLLADNEQVFREGLAKILKEHQKIEVVSECASGEEAVTRVKESKPDMVVLDDLASNNTPETVKQLLQTIPELKIAVICHPEKKPDVAEIIRAGGKACLSKNSSVDDLLKALELISSGRIIISPVFVESFVAQIASLMETDEENASKRTAPISERENDIVKLVVEGETNKEVAKQLGISENTVKVHVKNILGKLDLKNRQQLITWAITENWVSVSPGASARNEANKG